MIHYHGTPISGGEVDAVKALTGRHGFVSFASTQHMNVVAEVCSTFALDNGAFTFWKTGKATDWMAYYEFVEKWHRHPGFDWALIPDVIDGDVQQNQELMDKWPFSSNIGVPVWHLHEPIHWLRFLCRAYPRVAIGSSGEYSDLKTPAWWDRMAEAMSAVVDGAGRPICKLHGLRMLDVDVFTKFPFSSCDSTNVGRNCGNLARWKNYNPPTNGARAVVLAERIEAHLSAPIWSKEILNNGNK